jgi:hypothetical protein
MLSAILKAFFIIIYAKMKKTTFILFFVFFCSFTIKAQNFYRISGDFSIKSKSENASQLIIGKFYYDKNQRKIIHENTFPEFETWVTFDTSLYKIVKNKIVSRQTIPNYTNFSIYHMVLSNQLKNFGLEGSIYTLEKVEKEQGMVISTWTPNPKLKNLYGNVLLSTKDNNLTGIIFYSPEGKIIKKQFFEEYAIYNGLAFPGKLTEISYVNNKEVYQITTYKNIVVNDERENSKYLFDPSKYKL